MFAETVKLMADEPEKIQKAGIRGIRIILNIVIASWLYKWAAGPYPDFQIYNYNDWIDFVFKAQLLIFIFFYFISEYFVVSLLNSISEFLVTKIARIKYAKLGDTELLKPLTWFDVIRYSDPNDMPVPGKNIDLLQKISGQFEDNESREEIESLKNTYIENVWNLYLAFSLVYFIILDDRLHTSILTTLVIAGLIIVLFTYIVICGLIDYLINNHQKITSSLSFIKAVDIVNSALKEYGITPIKAPNETRLSKFKTFELGKKEYFLIYTFPGRHVKLEEIRKLLLIRRKIRRSFILIAPADYSGDVQPLVNEFHDSFIPVIYSDVNSLEAQLKQTIENIIN